MTKRSPGGDMKRPWLNRVAQAAGTAPLLLIPATAAAAAPAGDGPPGFWWGTDSFAVSVPGGAPYSMPFLGGAYGGYIGMTGNWAYWLGCGGQEHFLAFSATNAAQAHTNFTKFGEVGMRLRRVGRREGEEVFLAAAAQPVRPVPGHPDVPAVGPAQERHAVRRTTGHRDREAVRPPPEPGRPVAGRSRRGRRGRDEQEQGRTRGQCHTVQPGPLHVASR